MIRRISVISALSILSLSIFAITVKSGFVGNLSDRFAVSCTIGKMSLKDKVCQMFILRPEAMFCPGDTLPQGVTQLTDEMVSFFGEYPVCGFCLFPQNIVAPVQLSQFTSSLHVLTPCPLLCVDEEGGRVARIAGNKAFGLRNVGSMTDLASGGDGNKVYEASSYIGSYVRDYGFDVDFAPVADVNTNPDNVVIGARAFSDDPEKAAGMVVRYLKGLQDSGITGCIKHFPGHGDTRNDTHSGYAASNKTWSEMKNCEMIPFKAGIDAGAEMIMIAHIAAPEVTGSNLPSTMSPLVIQDKLRGELGYDGLIITDAMEMGAITNKYNSAEAAVAAVKAGADIVLMPENFIQAVEGVIMAVETGEISEERIDESVFRVLMLKRRKGLRFVSPSD